MNTNEKMEANNLIEEITSAKSDFFSASKAKRLIEIVPVSPHKGFTIKASYNGSSNSSEGYSPGIGNVSLPDEEEKKEWSFNEPKIERVGGYKIEHSDKGFMVISQMWADTYEDATGRRCRLDYNFASKEPEELLLQQEKSFTFPWPLSSLTVSSLSFVKWKLPSNSL